MSRTTTLLASELCCEPYHPAFYNPHLLKDLDARPTLYHYGSGDMQTDNDAMSTDEDIKSVDTPSQHSAPVADIDMSPFTSSSCQLESLHESLSSIRHFASGLEENSATLQGQFESNPLKWCQIINFLVQIHYDMGHPALKPNVVSLCAEYLAYLANQGHFAPLFKRERSDRHDADVRHNVDIRMALFQAVKYDQGFQMDMAKLFNMNYYPKPMVFSHNKQMYTMRETNQTEATSTNQSMNGDGSKAYAKSNHLIGWLRLKEMQFCDKIDWKFAVSTRYQVLMIYLEKLGFDTDTVVSQQYKNVKMAFTELKQKQQEFDDDTVFGFLCRYLLEMTYYKPDFYGYSKRDLVVGVVYSAFIIAQRWKSKFSMPCLTRMFSKRRLGLVAELDEKHPIKDEVVHDIIKKVIRIGRTPHSCFMYCAPIYSSDAESGVTTHYHTCKCILNCCLNTYLKFAKVAFGGVSKMPCLSTSNVEKFVEWLEEEPADDKQPKQHSF